MHAFRLTRRQFGAGAALAAAGAVLARPSQAQARRSVTIGMPTYPPALDPVLFNQTPTRRIVPQLFDTLLGVDYTKARSLRPGLAERVERVSDRAAADRFG